MTGGGELAPILARLTERRVYLLERVALMEAAGDLDTPGGQIALEAVYSELEFLLSIFQTLRVMQVEAKWFR